MRMRHGVPEILMNDDFNFSAMANIPANID